MWVVMGGPDGQLCTLRGELEIDLNFGPCGALLRRLGAFCRVFSVLGRFHAFWGVLGTVWGRFDEVWAVFMCFRAVPRA